jgi:hypothetical protein
MVKLNLKHKAIQLRKMGSTYSEIMKEVPVAKSTISLWLREVGLSKFQKQTITEKYKQGQLRGAASQHRKRLRKTFQLTTEAKKEVGKLSKRELWLVGAALYWAEGSKQRNDRISARCSFSNTDPALLDVFVRWLKSVCEIHRDDISFSIYVHENSANSVEMVKQYWADKMRYPVRDFDRVYFKKNKIKTNRQNTGNGYYGILRIDVKRSTDLVRKIAGWCTGIHCGIV